MTTESDIFDDVEQHRAVDYGFGDFKLLKTTAYASLYLVVKSGKRFLVKTTKDKSEWQERLLRREYELGLSAEHPNIVHVYTIEEVKPYGVAMIMEYVDGRTLGDYLAEKPSLKERKRIFDELLMAVEYLHKRGMVHNDIKPDNILVSYSSNTLRLIDFGLADSDAEYAMRTLGYTLRYASPELRDRGEVDARSDIYSLGVVMSEVLGASSVSQRAMQDDPARRYASIAELRSAWHKSGRRWWWLAIVFVFVVLVGAIYYMLPQHDVSPTPEATPMIEDRVEVDSQNSVDSVAVGEVAPAPAPVAQNVASPVPVLSHSDELLRRLEDGVILIARETADSVAMEDFMEFAANHIVVMWQRGSALCDEIMAETENLTERSAISNYYEYLQRKHLMKVYNSIDELPSVYADLEGEEKHFYSDLLSNNEPYRRYVPEGEDASDDIDAPEE